MTTPRDALKAVARTIANSGELPSEMSVVLQEADTENEHADIDLPMIEIQLSEVDNVVLNNSDLIGFITNDNGNRTGRIYHSDYEMTITIDIWTTPDDGYDPDDLGERLRKALYPHVSKGPQEPFLTDDGDEIDDISYFEFGLGDRVDDLLQTPNVRLWSQEVELWAAEEFHTDEEYITSVDYPADGDFNDTDNDLVISDT